MRRVFSFAFAVLLPLAFAAAQAPRADKAVIEGVVLRSGTDVSLFKVTVQLIPNGQANGLPPNPVATATTDAHGRFIFSEVDPGDYRLRFGLNGYVAQDYGQRVFPGSGTPVKLVSGQSLDNLVVRMIPTGTVSGRLLDGNGQPLGNMPVQLMRQSYQFDGMDYRKEFERENDARTNDRGEYRLFFVTPGRYVLSAGTPPGYGNDDDFNGPAGNRFRQNVPFTYYPGVFEVDSARTLNVRSGEELSGIEMIVNAQHTYNIRGLVVDARTGTYPASVSLALVSASQEVSGSRASFTAATGVFQFRDVPEGQYTVVAGATPAAAFTGFEQPQGSLVAAGSTKTTLAGADQDGIVITLQPGVPLSGRVRVDDGDSLEPDQLRVWLLPMPGSIPAATNQMRILPETNVGKTGAFQLPHVWEASYRIWVLGLPDGWYVKKARLGEQDVLNTPLTIAETPQNALEIVVSSKSAEIQVNAFDANQTPVPGARVVLVPAVRERTSQFESATANADGRVTVKGIEPGEYTLIAWEAIEDLAWLDPEVIKEAETFGKKLSLAEGGRTTADIRVVPAR